MKLHHAILRNKVTLNITNQVSHPELLLLPMQNHCFIARQFQNVQKTDKNISTIFLQEKRKLHFCDENFFLIHIKAKYNQMSQTYL